MKMPQSPSTIPKSNTFLSKTLTRTLATMETPLKNPVIRKIQSQDSNHHGGRPRPQLPRRLHHELQPQWRHLPWKAFYSKNHGESIEQEVDITSKSNNIHVTHLPTPKEWLKLKEDATIRYQTPKKIPIWAKLPWTLAPLKTPTMTPNIRNKQARTSTIIHRPRPKPLRNIDQAPRFKWRFPPWQAFHSKNNCDSRHQEDD